MLALAGNWAQPLQAMSEKTQDEASLDPKLGAL